MKEGNHKGKGGEWKPEEKDDKSFFSGCSSDLDLVRGELK